MADNAVNIAGSHLANTIKKPKRSSDPSAAASIDEARRVLAEAKIKAYVEKTVASAPELNGDQRQRLSALLGCAK